MTEEKILIFSCPGLQTDTPVLAPAILKSCALQAGFTASAIDLNHEVNRFVLQKYNCTFTLSKDRLDIYKDAIDYCISRIQSFNPSLIVISILVNESQEFAKFLCLRIKKLLGIKVIIGGSGIKTFIAENDCTFPQDLLQKKLIDNYINGDGEESFVEYLKGNYSFPGINSNTWEPITNLENYPFPNFDDYDLNSYNRKSIPVCDSRGCVRSCEFCDIIEHWKKYQYRSAEHIFQELLHQSAKYGIKNFVFYNSLTNGNMREFEKLLDLICEYNKDNHQSQMSWSGYFIVRDKKAHPERIWQKIKDSNGFLELGIESVVEHVRFGLGKKFYNVDIDYHLEMAKKYKIFVLLLIIVAYPTETKADFDFTYKWFLERTDYFNNTIKSVVLSLCAILPNTSLERNTKNKNIKKGDIPTVWILPESNISLEDRTNHFTKLQTLLSKYGLISKLITEYFEINKKEFEFFITHQND